MDPDDFSDAKAVLHRYLRRQRRDLLGKLAGLGERDVRWPMTSTGTNLLGLVKHVAGVQLGYFGEVFGRPYPTPLAWLDEGAEVNADMWATADESREEVIDLFSRSCQHADETIAALELDATGQVSWWPPERREVTLHQVMVHMLVEMGRHAGHADIIREMVDGRAGNDDGNLAEMTPEEWVDYRQRLEEAARRADSMAD